MPYQVLKEQEKNWDNGKGKLKCSNELSHDRKNIPCNYWSLKNVTSLTVFMAKVTPRYQYCALFF